MAAKELGNELGNESAKQLWTRPALVQLDNDANDILGTMGMNTEGLGTSDS